MTEIAGWVPVDSGYEKGAVWCSYHPTAHWLKVQITPVDSPFDLEFVYLTLPLLQALLQRGGLTIVAVPEAEREGPRDDLPKAAPEPRSRTNPTGTRGGL